MPQWFRAANCQGNAQTLAIIKSVKINEWFFMHADYRINQEAQQ
jgi:hypothetical protein